MITREELEKQIRDRADLRGANLYGANLCRANLCGANLREADLYGANLCRANLCGANLREADLRGANLCGANLRGANLCGADLYGANLCRANLYGADLYGADLCGADLCGANLCGANLNWTSHELLSEILRQAAGEEVKKRSFAGLVLVSRDWCWGEFLQLKSPELKWALNVLAPFVTSSCNVPEKLRNLAEKKKIEEEEP